MIRFQKSIFTAYATLLLLFAVGLLVVPMAIASLEIYLQKKPWFPGSAVCLRHNKSDALENFLKNPGNIFLTFLRPV